jgi:succinyl-CoA synthetase beta subunit
MLREHVAKGILAEYGVTVPEGRLCTTPEDAAAAARELGGPVYVKGQVAIGDRLAAGAVRRVRDADEAAEAALAILPSAPELLVERAVDGGREVYLGVQIRDDGPARFLMYSSSGGAGFDPSGALAARLPVGGGEAYEIRNALAAGGLAGRDLLDVSRLAQAAIRCALDWHLYTLELNPVLLTADGAVAVDAKMETDDYATPLVPDGDRVRDPLEREGDALARRYQQEDHRGSLRYVQLVEAGEDGARPLVGTHSVGGGESLVVLDALDEAGLAAANYCDTSGAPSREKVAFAARLVAGQPHITGLFFSSCIANQPLSVTAHGVVDGLREVGWRGPTVMRIAGNEEDEAIAVLRGWAGSVDAPVEVFGRDVDEWTAARRMAELAGGGHGWRS